VYACADEEIKEADFVRVPPRLGGKRKRGTGCSLRRPEERKGPHLGTSTSIRTKSGKKRGGGKRERPTVFRRKSAYLFAQLREIRALRCGRRGEKREPGRLEEGSRPPKNLSEAGEKKLSSSTIGDERENRQRQRGTAQLGGVGFARRVYESALLRR